MPRGQLVIERPYRLLSAGRRYAIYVDGDRVGRVAAGSSFALLVGSGQREVQFRLDWARSCPILVQIDAGATTKVFCDIGPALLAFVCYFLWPPRYFCVNAEGPSP